MASLLMQRMTELTVSAFLALSLMLKMKNAVTIITLDFITDCRYAILQRTHTALNKYLQNYWIYGL
jgi:hypothetical protein